MTAVFLMRVNMSKELMRAAGIFQRESNAPDSRESKGKKQDMVLLRVLQADSCVHSWLEQGIAGCLW